MMILVPLCPMAAVLMDYPANDCHCRARWPATGEVVPSCTAFSISPTPVMNVKLIKAHYYAQKEGKPIHYLSSS